MTQEFFLCGANFVAAGHAISVKRGFRINRTRPALFIGYRIGSAGKIDLWGTSNVRKDEVHGESSRDNPTLIDTKAVSGVSPQAMNYMNEPRNYCPGRSNFPGVPFLLPQLG